MPTLTVGRLSEELGIVLQGDGAVKVRGVAHPLDAGPTDIAPSWNLDDDAARNSRAAAFLSDRAHPGLARPVLIADDPRRALGLLLRRFTHAEVTAPHSGLDPRAAIDPSARVDPSCWVGPFVFVGARAKIDRRCELHPFCYVGEGAQVGCGCVIGPHAVVAAGTKLGPGCRLAPGSVVGYPGFGFYKHKGQWQRMPSRGGVELEAEVEVGANSCIDGGTLAATRVGDGAKIDNLVQIGHNAAVGARAMLCGQSGLAGSVTLGDDVVLAGQVGVADHVRIGARAKAGAKSGIARDVEADQVVTGYPAIEHRRWLRMSAVLPKLDELWQSIQRLSNKR
jgi:UDP-3-O-[3-hydroxymyristoyl] glucosamine N-acyltransferase